MPKEVDHKKSKDNDLLECINMLNKAFSIMHELKEWNGETTAFFIQPALLKYY